MESESANQKSGINRSGINIFRGVYGALFGVAVTLTIFVAIFGIDLSIDIINHQGSGQSTLEHVLVKAESWLAPLIGCVLIGFYSGWATYAPAVNGKHFDFGITLTIIFLSSLLLMCVVSAVIDQPKPLKGSPPVNSIVMLSATLPSFFVTIALTIWRMRQKASVTMP